MNPLDQDIEEVTIGTQLFRPSQTYIYFLTIDKVNMKLSKPTKKSLLQVRNKVCQQGNLQPLKPYQMHCFEYKSNKRLHYHCLLTSTYSFIKYTKVKVTNYSIKLIKLKTPLDIARTAGYISKLKIDKCDISHYNPFHKDL